MKRNFISNALAKMGVNKDDETAKLLETPNIKKSEQAKYKPFLPQTSIQIDLQFWNEDQGFKYLLVAADIASKVVDFEPLKSKKPQSVIDGMEWIFKRRLISNKIKYIYCDNGSEFKNEFLTYCLNRGIIVRSGVAGRKSQTGVVEGYNSIISKILAVKATVEQQRKINNDEAGNHQREWVELLPQMRRLINDRSVKVPKIKEFFKKNEKVDQQYKIGEEVHVKLEKPRDARNNKLGGKFRIGDFRYEKDKKKIVDVRHTLDNNPLRYVLEGQKRATYAQWELKK